MVSWPRTSHHATDFWTARLHASDSCVEFAGIRVRWNVGCAVGGSQPFSSTFDAQSACTYGTVVRTIQRGGCDVDSFRGRFAGRGACPCYLMPLACFCFGWYPWCQPSMRSFRGECDPFSGSPRYISTWLLSSDPDTLEWKLGSSKRGGMCPCGFDIPEACLVRLGLDGGFHGTGIDPGFLRVGRDPSGCRFHRIHPLFDPRFSSFRSWVRSGETTGWDSFLSRPVRPPHLSHRSPTATGSNGSIFPLPLSNVPFRFGFDTCGAGGGSSLSLIHI